MKFGFLQNRTERLAFGAGLALLLLTAVGNLGIIALDDYDFVISQIIPASKVDIPNLIKTFDIRSPVHPILLSGLSRAAARIGIDDPANQLRFVLFWISLIGFVLHAFGGLTPFQHPKDRQVFLALLGGYFLCPLFLSRPMIETAAAPFLTLSVAFACRYWEKKGVVPILASVAFLAIASLFRFQAGICILAWPYLLLRKKDWSGIFIFILAALLAFYLTGTLDLFFTGQFHASLRAYLTYNLQYAGEHYGHQPFYVFPLLFLAMTIPPALFPPRNRFPWKVRYQRLVPVVLYFFIFLLAHTVVPHKEERFMVPILVLFLMLITPLLASLAWLPSGQLGWRGTYFFVINLLLLIPTTFNIPQNNTIGLVRFLNETPRFELVINIADSMVIYPTAFATRTVPIRNGRVPELFQPQRLRCSDAIAIRADLLPQEGVPKLLTEVASFAPGILERFLVLANPERNIRRGTVLVYALKDCPQ